MNVHTKNILSYTLNHEVQLHQFLPNQEWVIHEITDYQQADNILNEYLCLVGVANIDRYNLNKIQHCIEQVSTNKIIKWVAIINDAEIKQLKLCHAFTDYA